MRWPWRAGTPHEAEQARRRAEIDLAIRRADASRLHDITQEWRRIRERNGFAAAFQASMKGGHR